MKIIVLVKSNAKHAGMERIGKNEFIIAVKEPPRENAANFAVMRVLAGYFGITLSRVRLVSGARAKKKVFEIDL